ncbi:MAG: M23 family metallopeptidase [Erysipelotrichaceae bacterium]
MKKTKIIYLIFTSIILIFITIIIYDTISFNQFKESFNDNILNINGVAIRPNNVSEKNFIFHSLETSTEPTTISTTKDTEIILNKNYTLTDKSNHTITEPITYLSEGKYYLKIQENNIIYYYDLIVDNEFTITIDTANAFPAGYLRINFFDLDENEEISITSNFTTAENFYWQEKNMLIPIDYHTAEGEYSLIFTSQQHELVSNITIKPTDFREDHFNISSTVSNNAKVEPDPIIQSAYNQAKSTISDIPYYLESGFKIPAKGYTTGDFGDIRYINGATTVSSIHMGIDYANNLNTDIYSTAKGKVIFADFLPATGNTVMVDHGQGIISRYLHTETIYVEVGEMVDQNSILAAMGTTGFSTGVHLHFEIFFYGTNINPYLLLNNSDFQS